MSQNTFVTEWVDQVARLTKPEEVHWCDGSESERDELTRGMVDRKEFTPLNASKWPNCFYYRSHPSDVARTEKVTFICCEKPEDAGPNNNWLSPGDAEKKVLPLFDNAMRGRTMYVIPYIMGPAGGASSRVGYEITDSPYVVLNMRIMSRMGKIAENQLGTSDDFVKGIHSLGDLDPERRAICHFPQRKEIWSVGSGYGGNALLGKKCHALRIASAQARDEGWMAEHMLILGLQSPDGEITYIAAAFPSACGKTNLAMVIPPESMPGWKAWTVGDDIAWMRFGPDGRLWAINPEAGIFGVAPGTSTKTNPNALLTCRANSIFTNVAITADRDIWWEGMGEPPADITDWKGQPWSTAKGERAAHPNSRFTAPLNQCPSMASNWEDPQGVPISAILFGGRRGHVAPLVVESRSWNDGVLKGASTASETTAAATGEVGVLRHDPMAMLPFCGYHMGDYFSHWIAMGKRSVNVPKVFSVNWFRVDEKGKFIWPGYGENVRVLQWIVDRCRGRGEAVETPIGYVPALNGLNRNGLNVSDETLRELLAVHPEDWKEEMAESREYFRTFGAKFPKELTKELDDIERRL